MEIIEKLLEQRLNVLIFFLLFIILGLTLLVAGIKMTSKNRLVASITSLLGIFLVIGTLLVSVYTLFLGVNF